MRNVTKKICAACNLPKTAKGFKMLKTGHCDSWCRECRRTYARVRRIHGVETARLAIGLPAKGNKKAGVSSVVISNGNKYEVCHVYGVTAVKPEVAAHRIMGNGQVLKRSVWQLGTNYRLSV